MADDSVNPFEAPRSVSNIRDLPPATPAQRAQELKHLNKVKQAKGILIVVGVLTLGFNAFLLMNAEDEAKNAVAQEIARTQLLPGQIIDPLKRQQAEQLVLVFCRVIYGGMIAMGVIFVILGAVVTKFPVPATVAGLSLYLVANGITFCLAPGAFASALFIKVVIVVSLIGSVRAALEYQRALKKREFGGPAADAPDMPNYLNRMS